jgi:hypothetical protein
MCESAFTVRGFGISGGDKSIARHNFKERPVRMYGFMAFSNV